MRKRRLAAVLTVMMLLSGCALVDHLSQQTPDQQLRTAYRTYQIALATANDLYETGRIERDTYVQVQEISIYVRRALSTWESLLADREDPTAARREFDQQMDRLDSLLGVE